MLLGTLVAVHATTQFGAENPLRPVGRAVWYHREVTDSVARTVGWGPAAAGELGWHAVGVDLYAYHWLWRLGGGPVRWRGIRWYRGPVDRLHFDNLATCADVSETWSRVLGGTRVAVEWAARRGDVTSARGAIGTGLHALQDFYSHSTWIDVPERRGRTWLESRHLPCPDDLSTGGFGAERAADGHEHGRVALTWAAVRQLPAVLGAVRSDDAVRPSDGTPPPGLRHLEPPGINLDSRWQARVGAATRGLGDLPGDAAFDLALDLAARDTRHWLTELDAALGSGPHAAFWDRVRSEPAGRWTDAYDCPSRLPYQFLAAGRPLPVGRGDAAAWFLRIEARDHGPRSRPPGTVAALAGDDTVLARRTPGPHATTTPLPAGTVAVRVDGLPADRFRVCAFRRAPRPVLRPVLDGTRLDGKGLDGTGLDRAARGAAVPLEPT